MPYSLLVGTMMAGGLVAAQMNFDMAAMQKWEAAKVIRFHVVGVHQGRTSVVFGDHEAKADVKDTLTLDFVWDKSTRKIVGPVTIVDGKSEVSNLKSDGTNCPPPALSGDYEHFKYVKHTVGSDGLITMTGVRTFPGASVSQYPASCSMVPVPGGTEEAMVSTAPGEPTILAMPMPKDSPFKVSPDKKSFTMPGAENWSWTLTPTVVR
jgi:hypothetical protein